MKNVISFRVTEKFINPEMEGSTFISRKVSKNQRDRLEKVLQVENEIKEKSTLSKRESLFMTIFFLGGCIVFLSFATSGVSLGEFVKQGWYILLMGIGFFAIALALFIWGKKKGNRKSVVALKEQVKEERNTLKEISKRDLKTPADAVTIDVLGYIYEITKKGKEVRKNPNDAEFINVVYSAYTKEDSFCIANDSVELTFPNHLIRRVEKVKHTASLSAWNKDVDVKDPMYKEFGLKKNATDLVYIKNYYRIVLGKTSDKFELTIPDYDFAQIKDMLPVSVEGV